MTQCGIILYLANQYLYIILYPTYSWPAHRPESLYRQADSEKDGGRQTDAGERIEQPGERKVKDERSLGRPVFSTLIGRKMSMLYSH